MNFKNMNKPMLAVFTAACAASLIAGFAPRTATATGDKQMTSSTNLTAPKGKYALVNGINLYYETYGTGQPLVLLHGGVGSIEMFGEVVPKLAKGRQVIAVDLQAHGRTADIDRPLSYEAMADDIAALIKHLGLKQADVMGDSLGGIANCDSPS